MEQRYAVIWVHALPCPRIPGQESVGEHVISGSLVHIGTMQQLTDRIHNIENACSSHCLQCGPVLNKTRYLKIPVRRDFVFVCTSYCGWDEDYVTLHHVDYPDPSLYVIPKHIHEVAVIDTRRSQSVLISLPVSWYEEKPRVQRLQRWYRHYRTRRRKTLWSLLTHWFPTGVPSLILSYT